MYMYTRSKSINEIKLSKPLGFVKNGNHINRYIFRMLDTQTSKDRRVELKLDNVCS